MKTTPVQLRNKLIASMQKLGFTLDEKENTAGAKKAWMTRKLEGDEFMDFKDFCEALPQVTELKFKVMKDTISNQVVGDGFEMELMSYDSDSVTVFIAAYNNTQRGLEYSMGVDC